MTWKRNLHTSIVTNIDKQENSNNVGLSSGDEDEPVEKAYSYIDHDVDIHSIYGCDQMPIVRKMSAKQVTRCESALNNSYSLKALTRSGDRYKRSQSVEAAFSAPSVEPRKRWFESGSVDTINLGSTVDIFGERGFDRNESKRLMCSFNRIVEEESKTAEEINDEEVKAIEVIQEKV